MCDMLAPGGQKKALFLVVSTVRGGYVNISPFTWDQLEIEDGKQITYAIERVFVDHVVKDAFQTHLLNARIRTWFTTPKEDPHD